MKGPYLLFDICGRVALITGATGGFGQAASLGLAKAGVKIMITGRRNDTLEPLAERIGREGGEVAFSAGSPVHHEDVEKVVKATVDTFGSVDILIAAAGTNRPNPIIEQPLEQWEMIMDVNVKGSWLYCKEVGKVMIDQGRGGKIILVSSIRGQLGMANCSAYCASKGAVSLMAKSLACEWGHHKINVNAIAPTLFRTPLTQWMFDDDAFYTNYLKRIPLQRLAEPEDFIGTLIYLSSKASDFLTGAILYVDGGHTAG